MINVPMESDSEDKGDFRDTNPSTSNQSVLVSSSSEHATCIRQVSTDDILDYIGFGFFQVLAFVLCSLTYFAYGLDISSFIFIAADIKKLWNLSNLEYALFPAITTIPNWLGAIIIGLLTDHFGRVWPYAMTMAIIGVFGIADAFSPSYAVLVGLRCLGSFGIGGISVIAIPTFIEFLPRKNRAKAIVLTNLFPALGLSAASGLAWWLIPTYREYGWRYFLIVSMVPSLLASFFRIIFYFQSPRFLIAKKKYYQAWKILSMMAWMNGRNLPHFISESEFAFTVVSNTGVDKAPIKNLLIIFKKPYLHRTLCLMGLIATNIMAYGGVSLFLPQELDKLHIDKYFTIFVSFIAQVPGILLAAIIVEWPCVGRLNSLRFFSLMSSIFFFLLAFVQNAVTIPVFLIFIYFALMPILVLLYTYISESYPTNIRSLSNAFLYSIQGIALVPTYFLSAFLIGLPYTWLYPTVWGSVLIVTFIFTLLLNYEPRQKKLVDVNE